MKSTKVSLSDVDLARLVDSADPEVVALAQQARDRIAAAEALPVPAHVAQLVVDVVAEARATGLLLFRPTATYACFYCGARPEWRKRTPRHRKLVEYPVQGVEFAYRFVFIQRHISVGGCRACVDQALPHLIERLADVRAEVPDVLAAAGRPRWRKHRLARCTKCGWSGHEGQMGLLPALLQGKYPGQCPSCGVKREPLGPDPFEHPPGFEVAEEVST